MSQDKMILPLDSDFPTTIEKDPIKIKLRQIFRETRGISDILAARAWDEEKPKLIAIISKLIGLTESDLIKIMSESKQQSGE